MAQIQLQPPNAFNFKNPDDWSKWFDQLQIASGLNQDPDQHREAEALLLSMNATADERKMYDTHTEIWQVFHS